MIEFTISFEGNDTERHQIDFYDVSHALIGFQRTLAITTHLVLNGEVITQSPSLNGAKIFAIPPEEGSWKVKAGIIATVGATVFGLGTASKDSLFGHLVYSAYDYVVSESLGDHVNYEKPLYQQFQENCQKAGIPKSIILQSKLDAVVEKCEVAFKEMHRPIYKTNTASTAKITSSINGVHFPIKTTLDIDTFAFINVTNLTNLVEEFTGRVSSYNSNTYKGRIYLHKYSRPISFELEKSARSQQNTSLLAQSLEKNVTSRRNEGDVIISGFQQLSKDGRLKGILVINVKSADL